MGVLPFMINRTIAPITNHFLDNINRVLVFGCTLSIYCKSLYAIMILFTHVFKVYNICEIKITK